ncbi:MAG: glucuronate isomerase [Clostridia bacterium]|nr:glucuronate isomerase [Clostridia bacterium]
MKNFMDKDFLLDSPTAIELFNEVKDLPIVDYHCHVDAKEIYDDVKFSSITAAWLGGDHYKWRAMRNMGVEEELITGKADDYARFVAWATIMPYMAGHPLYHFSHLELKRYLGIDTVLNKSTAKDVYKKANEALENLSVRKIIEKAKVEVIVTTNDPIDDLKYHKLLKEEEYKVKVLPAFRPDKAINIEKPDYIDYIDKLEQVVGFKIKYLEDLKAALIKRLDYFVSLGCKASDHGLDYVPYDADKIGCADGTFIKARNGEYVTQEQIDGFKAAMVIFCAKEYYKRDIAMEVHFGCQRNTNKAMFEKLGPDTGFDCVNDNNHIDNLYAILNTLAYDNALPKTLLYSLNAKDNPLLVSMMGAFNGAPFKGKVQQGSAWWFNDHKKGMEEQISYYAAGAPIGSFIGMLTDSRSFLSYARHEYFRRILCNYLGNLVENGEYPASEIDTLKTIARDICHDNAIAYFGFNQ